MDKWENVDVFSRALRCVRGASEGAARSMREGSREGLQGGRKGEGVCIWGGRGAREWVWAVARKKRREGGARVQAALTEGVGRAGAHRLWPASASDLPP